MAVVEGLGEDRWAPVEDGVRVHYLDSDRANDTDLTSLLYVHGAIGTAEDFLPHLERHAPRRCLALSMRGMGKSDTPTSGYGFGHKVADIEAVVRSARLAPFALFGFSAGVPCVTAFALRHPDVVRALILGDYEPRYRRFNEAWTSATSGVSPERARAAARQGMQRESADVDLWGRLPEIRCPVLVIRGGAAGAMLSAEAAERYGAVRPGCSVAVLKDAGHALWHSDLDAFVGVIEEFLIAVT